MTKGRSKENKQNSRSGKKIQNLSQNGNDFSNLVTTCWLL